MLNGELKLMQGSALRQGGQAVFLPQPRGHRLFNNGLTGGNSVEGGIEAVSLDRKGAVPGNEVLPGQGAGSLKEGVKIPRRKLSQQQKNTLPGAQVQVDPRYVLRTGGAEHPAVFRPDLRQAQPPQLGGTKPFKPKKCRYP